jgi:O-antigen ligase
VSALLFALVFAYIAYAGISLWSRPGFFAACIVCSYGLAIFFGPSGTLAAIVGAIAVAGARLAGTKPLTGLANAEIALLLFVAFMYGGAIFSPQLQGNYAASFAALGLITYLYARNFANHPTFARDFLWGSAFLTTATFIQLVRTSTKLARIGTSGDTELNPVGLATLCEIGFAYGLAALMFDREASLQLRIAIFLFLIGIVVPFILTTATRSVVISCGLVFISFALLFVQRSSPRARVMFAGATVLGLPAFAAAFIALAPPKLLILVAQGLFRFGGGANGGGGFTGGRSTDERLSSYRAAYEIFKDAPIFGHGIGSYGYLADDLPGAYPHNLELELMVSGGILGLLLFFLFLIPPFISALRETMRKDLRWERIAVGGILLSTFIRHQFSFSFASGKLLFFATGCFIAWELGERRTTKAPSLPEPGPAALPGPA